MSAASPRSPISFGAFLYWTLVLGVWGLIFVAGFLAVFATGLPDTSKLYDVSRQPSITYLVRRLPLLDARAGCLGPDFRGRIPGRVRHRPARHLQALRCQPPALDHLSRSAPSSIGRSCWVSGA